MNAECFPFSVVPGHSRLYLDYCSGEERTRRWYPAGARDRSWSHTAHRQGAQERAELERILGTQNAAADVTGSLERLRDGAAAVVTGQQVGLFGGPLFTPFKAATTIALAGAASQAGHAHVPVFWLAGEDHDFAEVNHVTFPARRNLRTLTFESVPEAAVPVGRVVLDESVTSLLDAAWELIGYSDAMEWLSASYRPGNTLAGAFAEFYSKVFASHGLLVLDAGGRDVHRLGAPVLRAAIERADELHAALEQRNRELLGAGYHAQVAVTERGSLLFLIDAETGARNALRRTATSAAEPSGVWQAGRERYSPDELLGILDAAPERISPSALLRPVFQDQILPTSAYIGGPAEIAYFAQSAILYERILGRVTPVLPRLSATLVEPAIGELLAKHELTLETVFANTEDSLAQRLAARAMPVEGKRLLANAGNALDAELTPLTGYMTAMDEGLGRSAKTAASKMVYQMNRLRRLAANFQLQKESALGRDAHALAQALYPHGGLQERLIGAAYFLARYGEPLIGKLIEEGSSGCPGHKLIHL